MPLFDYDDGFAGAGSALMFCCASCGVLGVQMTVLNTDVFVKLEMYNKDNEKGECGGGCTLAGILEGASFWCTRTGLLKFVQLLLTFASPSAPKYRS